MKIRKGEENKAIKSLKYFRGEDFDTSSEICHLKKEEGKRQTKNIRKAMQSKSSKKAMMISFGLMFFQQLGGINAVIFYMTTIFLDANLELNPQYATIIVGLVQVISTFVATLTLDKLGRRMLLMTSVLFMGLCTFMLAIYSGIRSINIAAVQGLGWLSMVSLCVFIIAFSIGFG